MPEQDIIPMIAAIVAGLAWVVTSVCVHCWLADENEQEREASNPKVAETYQMVTATVEPPVWCLPGRTRGATGAGTAVTYKSEQRVKRRCIACELGVHGYV